MMKLLNCLHTLRYIFVVESHVCWYFSLSIISFLSLVEIVDDLEAVDPLLCYDSFLFFLSEIAIVKAITFENHSAT